MGYAPVHKQQYRLSWLQKLGSNIIFEYKDLILSVYNGKMKSMSASLTDNWSPSPDININIFF